MGQSSGEVIALTAVFTFLNLFFVALRVWARQMKRLALATDDILILLAAVFYVLCLATPIIIQSADANLGNHIRKTPDGNPIPPSYLYNVVELIFEATHVIPITLAKCSILFLYKRIFRGPVFTAVVWTSLGIAVTWGLSYFFTLLFLCTPIPTYLRHGPSAPGVSCSNELQVYYSLSISDFLIDVIILVIPIPFVWRLKMPPRHKVAVTVIFLLGCLTIAASITRMVTFVNAANFLPEQRMDLTYYTARTSYWTLIEASLAIISACLPTLRPLFHGHSPQSIIRSFRSAISLGSMQTGHSNDSKYSHLGSTRTYKLSASSTARLHDALPMNHGSRFTANGTALNDMTTLPKVGQGEIMVQKSFVSEDEVV